MTSLTLTAAQVDALGDWLAQGDDPDDVLISERTDAIHVSQGDERASIGTDGTITDEPLSAEDHVTIVLGAAARYAEEMEARSHTDATIAQGDRIRASIGALRAR